MRRELLEFLVCPDCKSSFHLSKEIETPAGIESGELSCSNCKISFPIIRYVPRILSPEEFCPEEIKVNEGFGFQWNAFNKIEESDKAYFLGCIQPVKEPDLKDKIILDAGCGMGRFVYISSNLEAKMVIGVDFSSAIDSAWNNCKDLPNAHLVQASIYRLPFRSSTFDYAYSLGVLHHLREPEKGFQALVPLLKSGAKISAWVYGKEGNWWVTHLLSPIRKLVTSRMPTRLLKPFTSFLGTILYLVVKGIYSPVNRISPKLVKILPYANYLLVLEKDTYAQFLTAPLDHLHTPIAYYYSKNEFDQWFQIAGISDYEILSFHGYSWSGMGIKE